MKNNKQNKYEKFYQITQNDQVILQITPDFINQIYQDIKTNRKLTEECENKIIQYIKENIKKDVVDNIKKEFQIKKKQYINLKAKNSVFMELKSILSDIKYKDNYMKYTKDKKQSILTNKVTKYLTALNKEKEKYQEQKERLQITLKLINNLSQTKHLTKHLTYCKKSILECTKVITKITQKINILTKLTLDQLTEQAINEINMDTKQVINDLINFQPKISLEKKGLNPKRDNKSSKICNVTIKDIDLLNIDNIFENNLMNILELPKFIYKKGNKMETKNLEIEKFNNYETALQEYKKRQIKVDKRKIKIDILR